VVNKTTVASKIHHHDYARTTVHTRRLSNPDKTCNTTEGRTSPRAPTPPRSSPASATCSTANPAGGHSVECGARHEVFAIAPRRFPSRSSSAPISISATKDTPTSSDTEALTYPVSVFSPYMSCYNHYGLANPFPGGSGV
jgi:hypothetical protein